jgi:hypothetical protein
MEKGGWWRFLLMPYKVKIIAELMQYLVHSNLKGTSNIQYR